MKIQYLTLNEIYKNLLSEFDNQKTFVKVSGEGKYPIYETDYRFPVNLADKKFFKLFGIKVTDEIRQLNVLLKHVPSFYHKFMGN